MDTESQVPYCEAVCGHVVEPGDVEEHVAGPGVVKEHVVSDGVLPSAPSWDSVVFPVVEMAEMALYFLLLLAGTALYFLLLRQVLVML